MNVWRQLIADVRARVTALAGRDRLRARVDEEMRFHLEMRQQKLIEGGLSPHDAAAQARRALGNTLVFRETTLDMWMYGSFERFCKDVSHAFRMLVRAPLFTGVAVLSLALGIGANAAIFSLIDRLMLRTLPVANPQELVVISNVHPYPRFEYFKAQNQQVFDGILGFTSLSNVGVDGSELNGTFIDGRLVSVEYFDLLGIDAFMGRVLTADDNRLPGGHPVVVISYAFWQSHFSGDPGVLGRTVRLSAGTVSSGVSATGSAPPGRKNESSTRDFEVIGVLPPSFRGETVGQHPDFWAPMMMQEHFMPGRPWLQRKTAGWVRMIARLKHGVSREQALATVNRWLQQVMPGEADRPLSEDQRRSMALARLELFDGDKGYSPLRTQASRPLLVLMTMVAVVLLIACANLSNLFMARTSARAREISMRIALGASRGRIIVQLVTESLVLAVLGGAAAIAVAWWGSQAIFAMVAEGNATLRLDLAPDHRLVGFTGVIAFVAGLLVALVPSIRATSVDLTIALKSGSSNLAKRNGFARFMVVCQVALSVVMLIGAGLFTRTLYNMKALDLGYAAENLILMRVDPLSAGYVGDDIGRASLALLERIRAIPGVNGATFSENGLFSGSESVAAVQVEGYNAVDAEAGEVRFDQVGPGYFTQIGIPLIAGRDLTEADTATSDRVVVINENLSRFYFGDQLPIGRSISYDGRTTLTVVGVATNARTHSLREEVHRRMYVSFLQPIDPVSSATYEVRTSTFTAAITRQLRDAVAEVAPGMQIRSIQPLVTLVEQSLLNERFTSRLSMLFGVVAVMLAVIGLYGVLAYSVVRRTSEIGLRIAVGARPAIVIWMVLRETLLLVGLGLAVGVPVAIGLGGLVGSLLFGVHSTDMLTISVAVVLMVVVACLAAVVPSRRAAAINPVLALRH